MEFTYKNNNPNRAIQKVYTGWMYFYTYFAHSQHKKKLVPNHQAQPIVVQNGDFPMVVIKQKHFHDII